MSKRLLERFPQLLGGSHLHDAHRRAEVRRLNKHRQPQRGDLGEYSRPRRQPALLAHAHVLDLIHAGHSHQLLEQNLVHAHRRRRHPSTDIRHIERLEQSLHRAVLPERAV